MIEVLQHRSHRVSQGDVLRDIEFIESSEIIGSVVTIRKVQFPYVVVLTQDCDLEQEHNCKAAVPPKPDKHLVSVLVAPLYNAEHVFQGEHLSGLALSMNTIPRRKTPGQYVESNQNPRYHFLQFPADSSMVDSVVDFKHYFSISLENLRVLHPSAFVCQLSPLFREDVVQRFSAYLSRIGLPDARSPITKSGMPPEAKPGAPTSSATGNSK